ncbi:MAG: PulJ/GspJ family protein [Acidimicrobiales bacterium]
MRRNRRPSRPTRPPGRPNHAGFTLIEMTMVTALLGMVLATAFGALISFQSAMVRDAARTNAVDQAHLAIQQLDSQIRSANSFYVPSSPPASVPAGYEVVAYVQAGGNPQCEAWKVANNALQTRTWTVTYPADGTTPTAWRTVASDLDNAAQSVAPFQISSPTTPPYFGRLLTVDLYVLANPNPGSGTQPRVSQGSDVQLQDSINGLDIEYDNAGSACTQTTPL